jgi:hypothetical protein
MNVENFPNNLFLKPFLARGRDPNSTIYVKSLNDAEFEKGTVRGDWVFGLTTSINGVETSYKLVTSKEASICRVKRLDGVFSKMQALGFTVIKIPYQKIDTVVYVNEERVAL